MGTINGEVNIDILEKKEDGTFKKKNPSTIAEQVKMSNGKTVPAELASHYVTNATKTSKGHVQVGTNMNVSAGIISVPNGSTSTTGSVSLSSNTNSTQENVASTPNALKKVKDDLLSGRLIHEGKALAPTLVIPEVVETAVYLGVGHKYPVKIGDYIYSAKETDTTRGYLRIVKYSTIEEKEVALSTTFNEVIQLVPGPNSGSLLMVYKNEKVYGIAKINLDTLDMSTIPVESVEVIPAIASGGDHIFVYGSLKGSENGKSGITKHNPETLEVIASVGSSIQNVDGYFTADKDYVAIRHFDFNNSKSISTYDTKTLENVGKQKYTTINQGNLHLYGGSVYFLETTIGVDESRNQSKVVRVEVISGDATSTTTVPFSAYSLGVVGDKIAVYHQSRQGAGFISIYDSKTLNLVVRTQIPASLGSSYSIGDSGGTNPKELLLSTEGSREGIAFTKMMRIVNSVYYG